MVPSHIEANARTHMVYLAIFSTLVLHEVPVVFYFKKKVLLVACRIFSCDIKDLAPQAGIKPRPPALGTQSPNLWTTWEVPVLLFNLSILKRAKKPVFSVMVSFFL